LNGRNGTIISLFYTNYRVIRDCYLNAYRFFRRSLIAMSGRQVLTALKRHPGSVDYNDARLTVYKFAGVREGALNM